MANASSLVAVGERIRLRVTTGAYARFRGCMGQVCIIQHDSPFARASVTFAMPDGSEEPLADIPLSYLEPVEKSPQKRRSPLNLKAPKDDRREGEKAEAARQWLALLGYRVLGIGQFRSAAVCWDCTREKRGNTRPGEKPAPPPVKVFCPVHHKPVFSPDTGNDEGVPDWQLRHETRWPALAVLDVEWKRDAKAKRREKQVELAAAGWSVIVADEAALAAAIYQFEDEVLRIEPHPEIARRLKKGAVVAA